MEVNRPIIELVVKSPHVGFIEQARNFSNEFLGHHLLKTNETKNDFFMSPAQFGCLTGLLIILFSNYQTDKEKRASRLWLLWRSPSLREFLFVAICFMASMLLMPSIILLLGIFRVYKELDGAKLRKEQRNNFKGFLAGEDIVWACEDGVSKSIINVLTFVRVNVELTSENLLQSIRDRVHSKLILAKPFPKMFYRRRLSDSGYFYWTDENQLAVDDYVRFLSQQNTDQVQSEEEFKSEMSGVANEPLPADNTALWECLISQRKIQAEDDMKFAVIFRVHHSVGDGVALLRLLLETLADKENFASGNPLMSPMSENFTETIMRLAKYLITFLKTPSALLTMALRKIDVNQIHPETLSGNKNVNWLYESDSFGNYTTLLTAVKTLKSKFNGARFSQILLAALSKSLKDFFERKNYEVPEEMTVVIPARFCNSGDPQLRMENKFSVGLQTLPINIQDTNNRVMKVKHHSDALNASPDYLVNFWTMSFVFAIFPERILKAIMNAKHSTLAVSNLPGPNFSIKINGHELENIGFFLPNLGTTACGITILSYNNKLHFGIMADAAAIDKENLGEILNGMVHEIRVMTENKFT